MKPARLTLILASVLLAACMDAQDPVAPPASTASAARSPAPGGAVQLDAPVYDLKANPDGSFDAAETFRGIVQIRKGQVTLMQELVGVTGVAPIGVGNLLAVTGGLELQVPAATAARLYRVSRGNVRVIADLGAYEARVNPDKIWNSGAPESNPFDVVRLRGGTVLVADAAANDVLIVDERGRIDWVAVLTPRAACPAGTTWGPCAALPPDFMAQPVATSVAVGPDGAYYVGELTGFPGTPGLSRVWRIAPGSLHVVCPSAACTLVADGFTSIMDLEFGRDGTLYVTEFDVAGWLSVDGAAAGGPLRPVAGGRVQACNVRSGACTVAATGLSLPTAVAIGKDGTVWVVENESIPGKARVHPLS